MSFGGTCIDARYAGNEARYINHSCRPNCRLHRLHLRGMPRLAVVALCPIEANEELFYDYSPGRERKSVDCRCGQCAGGLQG